jgi:hypothetical protein
MNTEKKSPAYQVYPADWISSRRVRAMKDHQRGWYNDLLMEAWLSDPQCTLPDDDAYLQNLVHAHPNTSSRMPDHEIISLTDQIVSSHTQEVETVFGQLVAEIGDEKGVSRLLPLLSAMLVNGLTNSVGFCCRQRNLSVGKLAEIAFAEDWALVRSCFKKTTIDGQKLIYNQRQMDELNKQAAYRERKAIAGRVGAAVTNSSRQRQLSDSAGSLSENKSDKGSAGSQHGDVKAGDRDSSDASFMFMSPSKDKKASLRSGKKKMGERITAGFRLDRDMLEWALQFFDTYGLKDSDVCRIFDAFKDHWLQSTKPDAWKLDWTAAWRTWCRKHKEFNLDDSKRTVRGAAAGKALLEDFAAEDAANGNSRHATSDEPSLLDNIDADVADEDDLSEFKTNDSED